MLVTAIRASDAAPIAQKTIPAAAIRQRQFGQDVPLLLVGAAPAMTAHTETGTNWGYSYLRLRGMDQTRFVQLFTADKPVVFAFHGYQRAIHEIIHGQVNPQRFHVRGFNEEGTTTTPFDMVVLNSMSRYHLAALALKRVPRFRQRADALIAELENDIQKAVTYSREHFEDPPEIANWVWRG